jgi:hypothetical protein
MESERVADVPGDARPPEERRRLNRAAGHERMPGRELEPVGPPAVAAMDTSDAPTPGVTGQADDPRIGEQAPTGVEEPGHEGLADRLLAAHHAPAHGVAHVGHEAGHRDGFPSEARRALLKLLRQGGRRARQG